MKKNLFLVSALVMGMMSSCSSEIDAPGTQEANNGLYPVELSLGKPSVVTESEPSSKGIGTIGSFTNSPENKWNGEDMYVIMMNKATWEPSSWEKIVNGASEYIYNFNNLKVKAPTNAADGAIVFYDADKNTPRYYPSDDSKHAFFAYVIDDANANPTLADENIDGIDCKTVSFEIDGSQDLMSGVATPEQGSEYADISYSNKSARKGVVPKIDFKHLLTRFTFELKNGSGQDLVINSLSVESPTTGTMCVAYNGENNPRAISFDEGSEELLALKQDAGTGNLEPLSSMTLDAQAENYTPIGEALMVAPGQSTYKFKITMEQGIGGGQSTECPPVEGYITIPEGGIAPQGTSYNVRITVYGSESVEVLVALSGWTDGGNIDIDPDAE